MKDPELDERYFEYQMLVNQIKQIQQQVEVLTQHLLELSGIKEGLNEVSISELGKELLVPLGPGVFIKSSLKDNKEAIMRVGAGVAVDKDVDDVKIVVDKQIAEVKRLMVDMENELSKMDVRVNQLHYELSGK